MGMNQVACAAVGFTLYRLPHGILVFGRDRDMIAARPVARLAADFRHFRCCLLIDKSTLFAVSGGMAAEAVTLFTFLLQFQVTLRVFDFRIRVVVNIFRKALRLRLVTCKA